MNKEKTIKFINADKDELEKLRIVSDILRSSTIALTETGDNKEILETNKNRLESVYSNVEFVNDKISVIIGRSSEVNLSNEKPEDKNKVEGFIVKKEDEKDNQKKLEFEDKNDKVEEKKHTVEEKKEKKQIESQEKPTENKTEDLTKKVDEKKEETKEIILERKPTNDEAFEVIRQDIKDYIKEKNFSFRDGNKLPKDFRNGLAIKLSKIAPLKKKINNEEKDNELTKLSDKKGAASIHSRIGNVVNEVRREIKNAEITDAKNIIENNDTAKELGDKVRRDQEKKNEKAKEQKEQEKEAEEQKTKEENSDMAELIHEEIEVVKTSKEKDKIKESIVNILAVQEDRKARQSIGNELKEILINRKFASANEVSQMIVDSAKELAASRKAQ